MRVRYDKTFGKGLRTDQAGLAPRTFFDVAAAGLVPELVEAVLVRMRSVRAAYSAQRKYLTYASSLLLSYDVAAVRVVTGAPVESCTVNLNGMV